MKQPYRRLAAVGLCAALLAVSAWVCVPGAVPFTLQSAAVCFAACLLGGRGSAAAVGVYLAVGAVGAPVFAGFRGGVACLLSPTGGFLIGFAACAALTGGLLSRRCPVPLALGAGLSVCYLCGAVWFSVSGGVPLHMAALTCVVPYIIPDALCAAAAYAAARRVEKAVRTWL